MGAHKIYAKVFARHRSFCLAGFCSTGTALAEKTLRQLLRPVKTVHEMVVGGHGETP